MHYSKHAGRSVVATLLGAAALIVLLLVVIAVVALQRFSAWGTTALDQVTDATTAAVSQSRDEAARALTEARQRLASTRDRATQAVAEPEQALNRAADAAADEVTRGLSAAAAAVSGRVASASQILDSVAGPDPQPWPTDALLRQTHYLSTAAATEYGYISTMPDFPLARLRELLVGMGYVEHVISERDGALEALYRRDQQLLLSASKQADGRLRVDVREMPLAPSSP